MFLAEQHMREVEWCYATERTTEFFKFGWNWHASVPLAAIRFEFYQLGHQDVVSWLALELTHTV